LWSLDSEGRKKQIIPRASSLSGPELYIAKQGDIVTCQERIISKP
jgi:hypothetical protein